MLLHILQCRRQPPTTNKFWAPNVHSPKAEKARLPELQRVRWRDGLRGYLVPHLGHIKFEIFMLNYPWNHTAQSGESKKARLISWFL